LQLSVLVENAGAHPVRGPLDLDIRSLTADSRHAGKGSLFAALSGTTTDGARYVADALGRGSVAVLADAATAASLETGRATLLASDQPRRSFALICARFFETQPRLAIAVTGTNGKSSVAEFCRQFWVALGSRAATIGTLGVVGAQRTDSLIHTTPDPVTLHRELRHLADEGIERVAIEASSHGLDQHRLDGVALRAAGFTNLSQDHFDYHASAEAYLEAKARLFDLVEESGTAVINADAPEFAMLAERCRRRGLAVLSYGCAGDDIRLLDLVSLANGHQRLALALGDRRIDIELPLAGHFQAMNVLCAAGMIAAVEERDLAEVLGLATRLTGVRGRLEAVPGHPAGARVYVDYAHTPDALDNVLGALRGDVAGRLIVVFGAGGDRDRAKRPLMGAAATRHADVVYVTDDNPRSEDPADIRTEVLAGAPGAIEIGDRRRAIVAAIGALQADDVLVIAGKGHESGQKVGDKVLPFDDAEEARRAIADLGGAP
jgi:UDP-N-acetylmuramoyl-L-alanyl-D-glutamate--2,6-diaminopimelate ligase